jgi:hypothetical protein
MISSFVHALVLKLFPQRTSVIVAVNIYGSLFRCFFYKLFFHKALSAPQHKNQQLALIYASDTIWLLGKNNMS